MNATHAARRMGSIAVAVLFLIGGQAMASPQSAGVAPAAVPVGGVKVYSAPSVGGYTSAATRGATASCPTGQRVLGGGAQVTRPNGGTPGGAVLLQASLAATSTYAAQAVEQAGGYSGTWALTAYAVCAAVPASLGVEVVTRTSDDVVEHVGPSEYVNDVAAPCPNGKRVIGTGGVVGGPAGNASFQQIRPNQQGAYVFVQAVRHSGANTPFQVMAQAVCANPIDGWHVVIDGTDPGGDRRQLATAACADDEQLIGGGLTKGDGVGWAHVDSVRPVGPPFHRMSVAGGVPDPLVVQDWNIAAWAVCVTDPAA